MMRRRWVSHAVAATKCLKRKFHKLEITRGKRFENSLIVGSGPSRHGKIVLLLLVCNYIRRAAEDEDEGTAERSLWLEGYFPRSHGGREHLETANTQVGDAFVSQRSEWLERRRDCRSLEASSGDNKRKRLSYSRRAAALCIRIAFRRVWIVSFSFFLFFLLVAVCNSVEFRPCQVADS